MWRHFTLCCQDREEREKQASRPREKKEPAAAAAAVVVPTVVDSGSDTEVSDDAGQDEAAGQMDQMQFDLDIGNLSCVICKWVHSL